MHLRNIGAVIAVSVFSIMPFASTAGADVYWFPPGKSISDGSASFMLQRTSGTGMVSTIMCNSTVTGKTPGTPGGPQVGKDLVATLKLSNCSLPQFGVPVTPAGPGGPVYFFAQTPTWSPSKGDATGGGLVSIVEGAFEFKIKSLLILDCTLRIGASSGEGFELAPDISMLHSPVWRIKSLYVGVEVSGPTASECGQNGSWYLTTIHPDTSPHLSIFES